MLCQPWTEYVLCLNVTDREILRSLGNNVRKARFQANFTQECLAEMIGCHWTTIAYIEAGKHPFRVTRFVRLVKCLKISADRLLEGVPEEDPQRLNRIVKALARKRKRSKMAFHAA